MFQEQDKSINYKEPLMYPDKFMVDDVKMAEVEGEMKKVRNTGNSNQFLNEISHYVPLEQLYKVVKSCYYNDMMAFSPILVKIEHPGLLKFFDGVQYLLQVWEEGIKVFEKELKKGDDADSEFIQLVNLKQKNATIKIPVSLFGNQELDYSCFNQKNNKFYIAQGSKLTFFTVSDKVEPNQTVETTLTKENLTVFDTGLKIQGILMNKVSQIRGFVFVVLETIDSQLDFNRFHIKPNGSFTLEQSREMVPMELLNDPIVKVQHIFNQNINYSVALRKSNRVDIYWNLMRIDSPEDVLVEDVEMSFDTIYFKLKNGTHTMIEHKDQDEITYDHSVPNDIQNFYYHKTFYQNVKNAAAEQDDKKWFHWAFNEQIEYLFRKTTHQQKTRNIGILFVDGMLYGDVYEWISDSSKDHAEQEKKVYKQQMAGKVSFFQQDNNAFKFQYFIANQEKSCKLYVLTNQKFFEIDDLENLKNTTQLVVVQSPGKNTKILMQNGADLTLFEQIFKTQKNDKKEVINATLTFNKIGEFKCKKLLKEVKGGPPGAAPGGPPGGAPGGPPGGAPGGPPGQKPPGQGPPGQGPPGQGPPGQGPPGQGPPMATLNKKKSFKKKDKEEDEDDKVYTTRPIHSCVSKHSDKYLFFADNNNCHLLKIKNGKINTYKHQNSRALYLLDGIYAYSLSHSSDKNLTSSGLRLYNLDCIIDTKECHSFLLQNIMIGFSSYFDYSFTNSRLSFINSFDYINVIPALHRNTFVISGLNKKYSILESKILGNKFIILNNNNQLRTFNLLTGKEMSKIKLDTSKHDFSQYQVFYDFETKPQDLSTYRLGQYTKTLIMKTKPEPEGMYKDSDFYEDYQIQPSTKNQVNFIAGLDKTFHQFKLIEVVNDKEVKEVLSFMHPYYRHPRCEQQLYFSTDNQLMLEKLSDNRVFLYKVEQQNKANTKKDEMGEVKWRLIRKLINFPDEYMGGSYYLSLASPCFSRYIDLDETTRKFRIMNMIDQTFVTYVTKDLMNLHKKGEPQDLMNRFLFIDSNTFRIINEEGFEKIVRFSDKIKDTELQEAEFVELEYNRVPLFSEKLEEQDPDEKEVQYSKEWEYGNYFTNREPLDSEDTLGRLKRKYQTYKSSYYLEKKQDYNLMYPNLFTVDNAAFFRDGDYLIDLSFSYFHWTIIEQIEAGTLKIKNIDDRTLELILYNILPGGNTILHRLCEKEDELKQIFKRCHPNKDDIKEIKYHIPLLQNLNEFHETPLHLCNDLTEFKAMDTMLKYLQAYELDHHSRAINDLLPVFVEKDLPSFSAYMDSRLVQTDQLRSIQKGCLKLDTIGIILSHVWFEKKEFDDKLMRPKPIEQRLKCEFIDAPNLFNYDHETSQQFFQALSESENFDLFSEKAVRKIIDYSYPVVKEFTVRKLFIPYCVFMLFFVLYFNVIYDHRAEDSYKPANIFFQFILVIGSIYFLYNEFNQAIESGFSYLTSFWNYLDFYPPLFLLIIFGLEYLPTEPSDEFLYAFQSFMVFGAWLKLLYFMRIYKSTGFLIRIILEVIVDMRHFIFLLLTTVLAFGDAFQSLAKTNMNTGNEDDLFVSGFFDSFLYTYRMILGDFDTGEMGSTCMYLVLCFFFLCTVFNMIIMLNLLIAIISESFARINEQSDPASYQEMASMIAENHYLIPSRIKKTYDLKDRYFLVVTDLESDKSNVKDPLEEKIDSTADKILRKLEENANAQSDMQEQINKLSKVIFANFSEKKKEEKKQVKQEEVKGGK